MKRYILLLLLLPAMNSCKTVSYESAVNSNKDKFYGEDEKTALLLDDFKDVSTIAADISDLADEQAYSKDLCDFADMVMKDQQKMKLSMRMLAVRKGIKLPNIAGKERQKIYHEMQDIRDEKTFDRQYYLNMKDLFSTTVNKCDSFLDKVDEGPVRDFIAKQSGIYKDYLKKIDQLQAYMNKSVPQQQLTEK